MTTREGTDSGDVLAEAQRALTEGNLVQATKGFAAAVADFERQGNGRMQAYSLLLLAKAQKTQRDLQAAYRSLHQASRLAVSLESLEKGDIFAEFGILCLDMGRAEEAEKWLKLAVQNSVGGYPHVMCARLTMYGRALKELGRYAEALAEMRKAEQIGRTLPPINSNMAKIRLADLLRFLGEVSEAKTHLENVLRHFESEPIRHAFAMQAADAFMGYAWVLFDLGKLDEAAKWMHKAATTADRAGPSILQVISYATYADFLHRLGRVNEAYPWCVRAAKLARTTPGIAPRLAANAYLELATNRLLSNGEREAEENLRIARELAANVDDKVLQYGIALTECQLAQAQWRLARALSAARRAMEIQLQALADNPFLHGIMRTMASNAQIFQVALRLSAFWASARREQGGHPSITLTRATDGGIHTTRMSISDASDWETLTIMDAARCAYIREGLSRHLRSNESGARSDPWKAGPRSWGDAFLKESHAGLKRMRGGWTIRGRSPIVAPDAAVEASLLHARLGPPDHLKNRICEPIDERQVFALLPDQQTVLVQFYLLDDDLWVLPVWCGPNGRAQIVLGPHGIIIRPGILPRLRALASRQFDVVSSVLREGFESSARGLPPEAKSFSELYEEVWETIGGQDILKVIHEETNLGLGDLDLVLIPDGPLCEIPLHALPTDRAGVRLYERVGSVRYGLSLRTLRLQQECEESQRSSSDKLSPTCRGVVFANPDSTDDWRAIPGVREEVARLVKEDPAGWWVHGDTEARDLRATPSNFLRRHGSGNLLWACGHGVELTLEDDDSFALQLCDGQVGSRELLGQPYDFRNVDLFVLSACWLGKVNPGSGMSKEVISYHAILALRGCRRVTSALWPTSDDAAPEFADAYYRALRRTCFDGPTSRHPFAVAFKTAITDLRRHDGGRFDHEFFWAPYTFFGLG